MKNAIGGIAVIIGLILAPLSSRVKATSNFVISKIQPASKQSASEELIQISNISASAVDITGWRLEYFSASPKSFTTPSRVIKLSGNVPGRGDYILSSISYPVESSNASFASTLASAGGHLRLASGDVASPFIYDLVGWGTATNPEGTAITAPQAGEVLTRNSSADGMYLDTDNNAIDFSDDQNSPISTTVGIANDAISITELFPNPASPVTDASGEFIELYNSSDQVVTLKDYKLLSGSTLNHSYIFTDQVLQAHEYKAFYSADTKATLSNSGGKVQLRSPDGSIVHETMSYLNAIEGQAWALNGTSWHWTSTPTPNAENAIIATSEIQRSKNTKAKSNKKVSSKKPKVSGKVKGASTAVTAKSTKPSENAPAPMHTPVLASVGGLAVLYGVYEYRQDIANAYRKFRGNRGARS